MATQWTAGLSALTPLPAATLNTIGAAWETWTPVLTQGGTTFTTAVVGGTARYTRIQKLVIAKAYVQVTAGVGGAGAALRFSLPLANNNANPSFGNAWIYDASTATAYHAICLGVSSTAVAFAGDWSGGGTFGTTPNIQVTVNDYVNLLLVYEAA